MPADPYKTLGVERGASQDDIRRAYRDLAKQHHPDLNPGDKAAEERFKTIASANDILSDPDKRARLDRGEIDGSGQETPRGPPPYRDYAARDRDRRYSQSGAGANPEGWNDDELQDIFGSIFNEQRRARREVPHRGDDMSFTLSVGFLDAVAGGTRRLALPEGRTLDVRIPPGTRDGQTLRLRGQGGEGWNGGADGDALIEIRVGDHAFFKRDGDDIRLVLPISLVEAVRGGPVEVPTPTGRVVMQIPPHSDTGKELRLRGRGVPAHGDRPAGNLYATLQVVLGAPDAALDAFVAGWKPDTTTNPRKAMEDFA